MLTIQSLSNLLVSPADNPHTLTLELKCEIQSSIAILHMAYICALQQTLARPELLTRYDDFDSTVREDDQDRYNSLPQRGRGAKLSGRAGMDDDTHAGSDASSWLCGGAKGVLCLTLAVFRQPLVDGKYCFPRYHLRLRFCCTTSGSCPCE